MGIFSRMRDIISSNINAMLDKAEDPEKLVRLMIQEMEDTLVEIKASCAGTIANRKKLERFLEEAKDRATTWAEKARVSVGRGFEDLAREALYQKRRFLERTESLEQELEKCQALIECYQDDMMKLEEKLAGAREKQRLLIQRHIHAQTRKRAEEEIRRFDTSDAFVRFEKFETRIDRMEADADLVNFGKKPTLEEQISKLESDDEIEKELAQLKSATGAGENKTQK